MSNNKLIRVFPSDKELVISKLLNSIEFKYEELVAAAKIADIFFIDLMQAIALIKFIKSQYDFEPDYNWFIWNIYESKEVEKVIEIFINEVNKLVKAYTDEQQT